MIKTEMGKILRCRLSRSGKARKLIPYGGFTNPKERWKATPPGRTT
jgi:hypothetical protein